MIINRSIKYPALLSLALFFAVSAARADTDWPMWNYDAAQSGMSPMEIPDELYLQWVRELAPPRRAWPQQLDDQDKLEFDLSYSPVVMGERIFVSSMVNDSVTAYHIADGRQLWRAYADGPVRLAPAAWNGKVYAVSDDGRLYCLDAATGERRWRFQAAPTGQLVLGNNRVISMWAARGAPVVKDGTVYFAAGVWPLMGTFVFALDAETGAVVWQNTGDYANWQRQPHGGAYSFAGIAPQGYLAATEDRLVVSGGRSTPALLDRHSGELLQLDVFGKGPGGYRVKSDGDFYYNHNFRYHLKDGTRAGGGRLVNQDLQKAAAYLSAKSSMHEFWLPIDGWNFRIDPDEIGENEQWFDRDFDDSAWRNDVTIASSWQVFLDTPYHGAAWYRRHIELPDTLPSGKLYLHFGGVDEEAWIWVNGKYAGSQAIGPTGWDRFFEVDVTDVIQAGKVNQITVRAKNTIGAGGIWKPVHLRGRETSMESSSHSKLDGENVFSIIAARQRLFVTTKSGRLYAFGSDAPERPVMHKYTPILGHALEPRQQREANILEQAKSMGLGYILVVGIGDGHLVEQLALQSQAHIVGIDPDQTKTEALRRRFDEAGLYGPRIALLPGDPSDMQIPPYISSMIVVENPAAAGLSAEAVHDLLRPYGGKAFYGDRIIARHGPLPGAGQWTHQYADAARTTVSRDDRVRLPLGILWYGSESHDNILPRHAAGPRPQIAGGRLVILGVETINARDVYTGRELWSRGFPGIGHPFTNLELESQWSEGQSVYMSNIPGAAYIGSPYVTLSDSIYLRYQGRIYRLDPATGATLGDFALYPPEADIKPMDWGPVSVYGNLLITTTGPHQFDDTKLGWVRSWNAVSSRHLLVLDRYSGEKIWSRTADIGFRHNAIAAGNGKLFVIDGLSEQALEFLERRGIKPDTESQIIALNADDGSEIWQTASRVFGTYLAYSEEHDILLESGSRDTRSPLPGEPHSRVAARRGADGTDLWNGSLQFPAAILGDRLIPARPGNILNLLTGERSSRIHPITGQAIGDGYRKFYGCSAVNASTHLLLFRSGAAGFTDLEHESGTGNFGGFKSGCTASMIAADGVLNAPDYTRTCRCSYQNQTSLGLIHMPQADVWTSYTDGRGRGPIQRLGINLGAPGNRRADNGTFWTPAPFIDAPSPELNALINTVDFADTPNQIIDVSASSGQRPSNTLDGDLSTQWQIGCNRRGVFNQSIRYTLNQATILDRVNVVWRGPAGTQFRVQTRPEGGDWTTVAEASGQGTDGEAVEYRFDPVKALQIRLAFGEHTDTSEDRRGRRQQQTATVSHVRIGGLRDPDAYAYFMPKPVIRRHALEINGDNGLNWVAASGVNGIRELILPDIGGEGHPYRVTLHFVETETDQPGERMFDVIANGNRIAAAFDILEAAGGKLTATTLTLENLPLEDRLELTLRPVEGSRLPPVMSGVELIRISDGQ